MAVDASARLGLPMGIVTQADVGHLMVEAERVDSLLQQAAIRQPGTAVQLPKTSRLLEEFITINHLNLLQQADRQRLQQTLETLRTEAPVLHMSFSADPSAMFMQKLIAWIRQQMHPYMLIQVGLQPNIGAGCVVRSTNKYYDFSLRQKFSEKRGVLIEKLRGDAPTAVPDAPVAAPATQTAVPTAAVTPVTTVAQPHTEEAAP